MLRQLACDKLYVQAHGHLRHGLCSLLDRIQPRVVSYEEQVTTVREHLASLLEKEEDWSKAAQTLAGIDLDSGKPVILLVLPQYANPSAIWALHTAVVANRMCLGRESNLAHSLHVCNIFS